MNIFATSSIERTYNDTTVHENGHIKSDHWIGTCRKQCVTWVKQFQSFQLLPNAYLVFVCVCVLRWHLMDNTENYGSILYLINRHFELMTTAGCVCTHAIDMVSLHWWHWTQTNNNRSKWPQKWSMNQEFDEPTAPYRKKIQSSFWIYLYSRIIITINNIRAYVVQNMLFQLIKTIKREFKWIKWSSNDDDNKVFMESTKN